MRRDDPVEYVMEQTALLLVSSSLAGPGECISVAGLAVQDEVHQGAKMWSPPPEPCCSYQLEELLSVGKSYEIQQE